jgi:hypothetical protein
VLSDHVGRQRANRRIPEKNHNRHIVAQVLRNQVLYSNQRYRISANLEEIIVDTYTLRSQDLLPNSLESALHFRTRRKVNSMQFQSPVRQWQLGRIDLTPWSRRYFGKPRHQPDLALNWRRPSPSKIGTEVRMTCAGRLSMVRELARGIFRPRTVSPALSARTLRDFLAPNPPTGFNGELFG